ncbi:hypothetical protein FIBSPDRAFT_857989 [Athelia psychrophila]|uniref:Uncharacterized protein n=1 Tax=Athelia psychrophila TaxID=1759441 RepID=A0A166MBX6_9AGAM|nr:hypothetical protein FIBSPDRAFT_857989 [Fibularhizoctonia sp. CBS 109695]
MFPTASPDEFLTFRPCLLSRNGNAFSGMARTLNLQRLASSRSVIASHQRFKSRGCQGRLVITAPAAFRSRLSALPFTRRRRLAHSPDPQLPRHGYMPSLWPGATYWYVVPNFLSATLWYRVLCCHLWRLGNIGCDYPPLPCSALPRCPPPGSSLAYCLPPHAFPFHGLPTL